MATKTFDQLTAASTIVLTDILALEHDPAGTPATVKMTLTQLVQALKTSGSRTLTTRMFR